MSRGRLHGNRQAGVNGNVHLPLAIAAFAFGDRPLAQYFRAAGSKIVVSQCYQSTAHKMVWRAVLRSVAVVVSFVVRMNYRPEANGSISAVPPALTLSLYCGQKRIPVLRPSGIRTVRLYWFPTLSRHQIFSDTFFLICTSGSSH